MKLKIADIVYLVDKSNVGSFITNHLNHTLKVVAIHNDQICIRCDNDEDGKLITVMCIECLTELDGNFCSKRFQLKTTPISVNLSTKTCTCISLLNGCGCGSLKK